MGSQVVTYDLQTLFNFVDDLLRPQAVSQELLPETDSGALSSEDDVEAEESSSAFGRLSSPVSADPDRQTASSSAQDSNPYSNLASTSSSAAASSILSIPGWSAAGVQDLAAGIKRVKPLYNTERWSYHRDTSRYFRHLAGLFQSSTFRKLRLPLLYLTANAAVICIYLSMQDTGMLPAGLPIVKVGDTPFELTSFALALLLVFRTDTSYSRWSEALTTWSSVRNTSNEFIRDSVCWVTDVQVQALVIRWTTAFSKTLLVYLRQRGDIRRELQGLLLPHEIAALVTAENYPQYVLQVLTEIISRAQLPDLREDKLLNSLKGFNDAIGVGEKLLRYPIPLTYTRHTSRFMLVWLAALPLAIWDDCGWATPMILGLVSFFLLGIEEIGVSIEEPFSQLPLHEICKDIQQDLAGVVAKSGDIKMMIDFGVSSAAARGEGFDSLIGSSTDWMWDLQAPDEQRQLQMQLEDLQSRSELLSDDPAPNMLDDDLDAVSGSVLGGVYWEMLMPKSRRSKESAREGSNGGSQDEGLGAWGRVSAAAASVGGQLATLSAWDTRSSGELMAEWGATSVDEGDGSASESDA
ncbi:MAG: hypothetical protein WDW36_005736 [Sanguina aurantia]